MLDSPLRVVRRGRAGSRLFWLVRRVSGIGSSSTRPGAARQRTLRKLPIAMARGLQAMRWSTKWMPAIALMVIAAALPAAHAAEWGAIVGRLTTPAGAPVANATVTAVRPDGGAIRATISGGDGVYSFGDLSPGTWIVTAQVAGLPAVSMPTLRVVTGTATRSDLVMNVPPAAAPAAPAAVAGTPAAAPSPQMAAAASAAVAAMVPEALQAPPPAPEVDTATPFAVGDLGWMNGTTRTSTPIFDTKFFTPEVRFDVNYLQDFNHPVDHTIVGSTEEFRSGEFQIEQVSFGGNFHWHNVHAGIFVSYIGLFSYYNFDNWTYQPSFVSSNTPWFFNGLRVQWFPTQTLKIEPWLINGWQSYAKFNSRPGFGGQILWIPNDSFKLVFNSYSVGQDNLASGSGVPNNGGNPNAAMGLPNPGAPYVNYAHVTRVHEDDSLVWKYYDAKDGGGAGISKMAMSVTWDIGCEYGGGVSCSRGPNKESFVGVMAYDRTWFHHDLYAVTIGGGFMNNPGRYMALLPPINGATAATGTPYFSENPGQKLYQWDMQLNLQYMPKDWITWWTEATFRHSDVPYWTGSGGVTPPAGNNGAPGSFVCNNNSSIGADGCATEGGVWYPDLRTRELIWGASVMVKF